MGMTKYIFYNTTNLRDFQMKKYRRYVVLNVGQRKIQCLVTYQIKVLHSKEMLCLNLDRDSFLV